MKGKFLLSGYGLLTVGLLIVLVGSAFISSPHLGLRAAADTPPGPDRFTFIVLDYTLHHWWMALWKNDVVVCKLEIDHDGFPTYEDVFSDCRLGVYNVWTTQDLCLKTKTKECMGYYVYEIDSEPAQREITVELPPAQAWVSLENCETISTTSTNICEYLPTLVITGEEPLPNAEIIGIGGFIEDEPFSCDSPCYIDLAPTDEGGKTVEFWSYSSYGDSSEIYSAQVRVVEDSEGNPDQTYWYVDVLSDQWTGVSPASCAESWEAFPPVGGPPVWLTTPKRPQDLVTDVPYNYLAANLIQAGIVDASACSNNGMLESSYGYGANNCGLETARDAVIEWQNRFDDLILEVAGETKVPAQLLKRLFARESQFWPAIYAGSDIGLGQLTENGADTTLLWNSSFYYQFCPLVLPAERCDMGYLHLDEEEQAVLRLGLTGTVNAACAECPLGIDLSRANFSVNVFGHALQANCEQTGRIIRNVSKQAPGKVSSYEDLWKFTLINYHAGPGCLGEAVEASYYPGQPLTWEEISINLLGVCSNAIDYVNEISN